MLRILGPAADDAGCFIATTANLTINPGTWVQPDLAILHTAPDNLVDDRWVPIGLCLVAVELLAVELASPGGRRDRIDKPALYASGGVPYFIRVEIVRSLRHVSVALLKLTDGRYTQIAAGLAGQVFQADEPFPIQFAPEDLLY